MKILGILLLAASICTASVLPSLALLRRDFASVEGPVLSKKETTKEITVRNSAGRPQTFVADEAQFHSAGIGDTVLILHQIDTNSIGTLVVTQPKIQ